MAAKRSKPRKSTQKSAAESHQPAPPSEEQPKSQAVPPGKTASDGPECEHDKPVSPEADVESGELSFPVVGIGASAGGLEALREVLEHLPASLGMALVFVQHLDPRYKSNLVEILGRSSSIPVHTAADGTRLEKGHLYVIPPDRDLAVMCGRLQLMSRPEKPAVHLPVDYFLRCLAEDQGANAVGVILSGTGSDGALGLRAIKAHGGISLVQRQDTAKYDGMPAAAVATGHVDFLLAPKDIATELVQISRHPRARTLRDVREHFGEPESDVQSDLQKIFVLLRRATGVDFADYKRTTVERRLARRMLLHRIESLRHYVKYLQQNVGEAEVLFEDLLINVTSFFRDPAAFQALQTSVFPKMLADKPSDALIRI